MDQYQESPQRTMAQKQKPNGPNSKRPNNPELGIMPRILKMYAPRTWPQSTKYKSFMHKLNITLSVYLRTPNVLLRPLFRSNKPLIG